MNSVAAAMAPWHAKTKARTAELTFVENVEGGQVARASALAREALGREPTNVVALRTLGLAAQASGEEKSGARQLVLADRLTRRDLPSQFYAIESAVGRNDVAGAIRHYDIALRVNRESWPILMPVLVNATGNVDVIPPLAKVLARKPQWADVFMAELNAKGPSARNTLLLADLLKSSGVSVGSDVLSGIFSNLVTQRSWNLVAKRASAERARKGDTSAFLTDGTFSHPGKLQPIDWSVSAEGTAAVQGAPGQPKNLVLAYSLTPGLETELARQVLTLQPGTYRISARLGKLSDAAPSSAYFRVDCADGGGQRVLDRAGTIYTDHALSASFTIPTGCAGQWLQIRARAPDVEESAGWIDDIAIARQ